MPKSEVALMFEALPKMFVKGSVKTPRTFYFSLDDVEKWTVSISADACTSGWRLINNSGAGAWAKL